MRGLELRLWPAIFFMSTIATSPPHVELVPPRLPCDRLPRRLKNPNSFVIFEWHY